MFDKPIFSGEKSTKRLDFAMQRVLFDAGEATVLPGEGSLKSFLFGTSPYIGLKMSPETRKALEAMHFSALENWESHQYAQMEAKYTQILDQLKLFFNDYKINKNTLVAKNIAIRNLINIAYYNRGLARFEQAKSHKALEDLQALLSIDDTHLYALYQRALTYAQQGGAKLADEDFKTVCDNSLMWRLNLSFLLDSPVITAHSETTKHQDEEPEFFTYSLNSLFFYAPNELRYLSMSGTQEIMKISDMSLFVAKIHERLAGNTSSKTPETLVLSTETLIDELGVTVPYFPRFLSENARLRVSINQFDWPNTKRIAQSILDVLSSQTAMTNQETIAAQELALIAREAAEGEAPMLKALKRKPVNTATKAWGFSFRKVAPELGIPGLEIEKELDLPAEQQLLGCHLDAFFSPIDNPDKQKAPSLSVRIPSEEEYSGGSLTSIQRPAAPGLSLQSNHGQEMKDGSPIGQDDVVEFNTDDLVRSFSR